MTTASDSIASASLCAGEDEFGILATQEYQVVAITGFLAILTREAARGTVSVDEASAIRGEARGGHLTGKPSPTKITGA